MNEKVLNEYNNLIKKYGENQILFAAAVGPGLFNQDSKENIQIYSCIIPTEEELYNNSPLPLTAIDIRTLVDFINNKNTFIYEWLLSPYKIINPKYEYLFNQDLLNTIQLLFLNNNKDIINNIKNIIKQIIIKYFDSPTQEQELLSIITDTERKALKYIIEDFNNNSEGDIKVSQATLKYNISTSVFRTLFYKLKDYNVAEIDSRGVKGTHIKFNNIKNLKILIDKNNN